MDTNSDIEKKIQNTLDLAETIEEVKVSPFFKDQLMQKMFEDAKEDERSSIWSWFTPQVQIAAIVALVVLNVIAFSGLNSEVYDEDLYEFAENLGISDESSDSIF